MNTTTNTERTRQTMQMQHASICCWPSFDIAPPLPATASETWLNRKLQKRCGTRRKRTGPGCETKHQR
jgi:hypothetical protein